MLILKRVLLTPPLRGKWAWLVGLAAVAVPTLIRAAVQGSVSTGLFVTYIPFVLLVVLLLRPAVAALLVVTFAIVADFFFIEPYFALAAAPNDLFGVGAFLITSALIMGFVRLVRSFLGDCLAPDAPNLSRRIIFSEREGQAWASWHSPRPAVKLGAHTEVAKMMKDYIAQVELGDRLNNKP